MIHKFLTLCLIAPILLFAKSISLISPNGGEKFTSGQPVTVQWDYESLGYVFLEYSFDNGKNWNVIKEILAREKSYIWVPYTSKRVDNVYFRIIYKSKDTTISDMSDSGFSILPSPDIYEPNNSLSTAYPVSVGDSSVKNASVFQILSTTGDTTDYDVDYYKVLLEAGKVLTVSMFHWEEEYGRHSLQYMLYDSSGSSMFSTRISFTSDENSHTYGLIERTGTYFIKIFCPPYDPYGLEKYSQGRKYGLAIQVSEWFIFNPPFDISDTTFTILASPNDEYEPNNDFASAKPLETGDTVVKTPFSLNIQLTPILAKSIPPASIQTFLKSTSLPEKLYIFLCFLLIISIIVIPF